NHQGALNFNNLAGNPSLNADGIAESGGCRDKPGTAQPLGPATSLFLSYRHWRTRAGFPPASERRAVPSHANFNRVGAFSAESAATRHRCQPARAASGTGVGGPCTRWWDPRI